MTLIRITSSLLAVGAWITVEGCAGATQRTTTIESTGDVAANAAVTPVNNRTIPIGATLVATLDKALGTKVSKVGDMFTVRVSNTLHATNGSIVVPAGAEIEGHVTAIDDSDNATEPALIRLSFDRIRFDQTSFPFGAAIVQANPVQMSGQSSADQTKKIVIGGAVGAALGGILGGGDLDKIVIGGAFGAAAGTIISLGTEVNATLPAGSHMTLRATQTTTLR